MRHEKKWNPLHGHERDHRLYDPITGMKVWASECRRLPRYSGFEGLYTTAFSRYKPHMGFAPYKIPNEEPIPFTYNGATNNTPSQPPLVFTVAFMYAGSNAHP